MKRKNLLMAFFMLLGIGSYSQTLTLQSLSNVAQGAAIQSTVTASGYPQEVVAFQFSISYDTTVLTYVSVTDWFPNISGVGIAPQFHPSIPNRGIITFVWGESFSVPLNGVFFKLNFIYKSHTGACSYLNWGNYPTPLGVWDQNYGDYIILDTVNAQICGIASGIDNNTFNNASVEIYPTIAKEKVNIKYNVPENGKITLGMYNLMGDEVQKISNVFVANNEYNQEIKVSDLSSGLYFIKYQIETANINTVKTEKITITR